MNKIKLALLTVVSVMGVNGFCVDLPLSDDYARAKAEEVKGKLSLEQKVSLLGGCATMYLKAIPEAGIYREWAMSDCSHTMKPEHGRADWPYVQGVDDRSTALAPLSALGDTPRWLSSLDVPLTAGGTGEARGSFAGWCRSRWKGPCLLTCCSRIHRWRNYVWRGKTVLN